MLGSALVFLHSPGRSQFITSGLIIYVNAREIQHNGRHRYQIQPALFNIPSFFTRIAHTTHQNLPSTSRLSRKYDSFSCSLNIKYHLFIPVPLPSSSQICLFPASHPQDLARVGSTRLWKWSLASMFPLVMPAAKRGKSVAHLQMMDVEIQLSPRR